MAYISLYRKYRPQTFEDVVGQEHVTTTLRNAVSEGRVASGYLFTGTRGTAKTTCARILAKALNCIGPDGSYTAPTPEPCGVCGPCRSIAASSFVDVLEMDAASHGKVDDVRDLVASIKFPPMEGRYKVYIIDEAHQLSRDAMDAFLKTLEEPPDRVVFVLATTELDKLPITIASRCQVYEFKRGTVQQISARVAEVLAAEGVAADPAAVTLIARAADGSYRDSLSLLEQVLAYERERVTVKDVTVVLGTIDEDVLRQVVELIADSDAAGAFALVGTILESGKDVRQFLKSLVERFRDMLFLGVGAQPSGPDDLGDSAELRAQASRFAPAALLQALEVLTTAEQETKRSSQHRLLLEMSLLRLMRLPSQAAVIAPMAPSAPKNGGNGTHLLAPFVPHSAGVLPKGEDEEVNQRAGAIQRAGTSPSPTPSLPALGEAVRSNGVGSPPTDMPPPLTDEDLSDLDDDLVLNALLPGDEDLDVLPLDLSEEKPSLIVVSALDHEQAEELLDDLMQVQQVAFEAPVAAPPKPAPDADAPPELTQLQKSWQEVLNLIGSRSPVGVQDVKAALPIAIQDHAVILEFDNQFSYDRVQSKEKGRKMVEEIIDRTLGAEPGTYHVKCVMAGQALPSYGKAARTPEPVAVQAAAPDLHGPFVDEVIRVFGGRVLDDDGKG